MGGGGKVVIYNMHVSSDKKFDMHNMTLHKNKWTCALLQHRCVGSLLRHFVHASGVGGASGGGSVCSGDIQEASQLG